MEVRPLSGIATYILTAKGTPRQKPASVAKSVDVAVPDVSLFSGLPSWLPTAPIPEEKAVLKREGTADVGGSRNGAKKGSKGTKKSKRKRHPA